MGYKNCIVFIMGFTGAGKHVVAKKVAKHPHFKNEITIDSTDLSPAEAAKLILDNMK